MANPTTDNSTEPKTTKLGYFKRRWRRVLLETLIICGLAVGMGVFVIFTAPAGLIIVGVAVAAGLAFFGTSGSLFLHHLHAGHITDTANAKWNVTRKDREQARKYNLRSRYELEDWQEVSNNPKQFDDRKLFEAIENQEEYKLTSEQVDDIKKVLLARGHTLSNIDKALKLKFFPSTLLVLQNTHKKPVSENNPDILPEISTTSDDDHISIAPGVFARIHSFFFKRSNATKTPSNTVAQPPHPSSTYTV